MSLSVTSGYWYKNSRNYLKLREIDLMVHLIGIVLYNICHEDNLNENNIENSVGHGDDDTLTENDMNEGEEDNTNARRTKLSIL